MPTVTDNDLDATNDTCESVQHKRIICEYNTTRGINSIANIVLMEDNGTREKINAKLNIFNRERYLNGFKM